MRAEGDTVESAICDVALMAMLTLQPTTAPQQCCCVGISQGGMSALETSLPDVPRSTDAEPAAAPIGIACPDIGTAVSLPAELATAD